MNKWKLMITTVPVAALAVAARFLLEAFLRDADGKGFVGVMDFAALAPVLTGGVCLIGRMLSGTMADYKESEKIPAELACCLETMEETIGWVGANKPSFNVHAQRQTLAEVTEDLVSWLLRRRSHAQNFASLERLNTIVKEIDKVGANIPASRFVAELHNLRRTVTRIGVISRTGFLASGYALLDILVAAVLVLLVIASYKTDFGVVGKYIIIGFVSLIYTYLWRLVRDLDDPFEYSPDGLQKGAAEIELFPLLEYKERALARVQSAPKDPSEQRNP
jgi:hypothetical protein